MSDARKRVGHSWCGTCPHAGIVVRRDAGNCAIIRFAYDRPNSVSDSPQRRSTGTSRSCSRYQHRYQHRLHTLTISGILLSRETLFQMYEDVSLRFYRSSLEVFELYTHYMYEKIFGEAFVLKMQDKLDLMRQRFFERFKDRRHCLIRLTEAQDPFFAALDERMPEYRAILTPTLIMAGAEDRAIPPWVQQKLCAVLPNYRFELVAESGHCVYIEQPAVFFENLKRVARAKSLAFEGAVTGD